MTPQRRQYEYRISNNLCFRCGEPLDRDGMYCQKCLAARNQYNRENREFCRKYKICPKCGKEKLMGDEKSCPECRAKDAAYKANAYKKNPEKIRKQQRGYQKKRYAERLESSLCTKCGKRKPDEGYVMCGICRAKDAEKKRLRYKRKNPDRGEKGICYRCGKPIEDKRYKLCNECVAQNRENCKKLDRSNHYWKQLDKAIFAKG